jgi:hypothetical protein
MSFAYLDPGAGSLLASVAVGGLAGVGVAASRVRAKFRRKGKQQPTEFSAETGSDETGSDEGAPRDEVPTDAAVPADESASVRSD